MSAVDLYWLPLSDSAATPAAADQEPAALWRQCVAEAGTRMDFIGVGKLDRKIRKLFPDGPPREAVAQPVRLSILSSSTADQLAAGIRVAGLRRGLHIEIQIGDYGQYRTDILDPQSSLARFKPTAVLLALDPYHLIGKGDVAAPEDKVKAEVERIADDVVGLWRMLRENLGCSVIHQLSPAYAQSLFGGAEHRLPGSPRRMTQALNTRLRELSDVAGVDLLSLDDRVAQDGLEAWHDTMLWRRAKQEVSPAAGPAYGDLVARLLAAQLGRSSKCIVLDLDNTLWGGVIGDDGLEGLVLGQGSALGEAHVAFQQYVLDLARRGIIVAVCSKNDEARALEPFLKHPEMVLRQEQIACFIANWDDKASNIREIARRLNIGLDSLVFVDDNPFERNIVRRELPMVAVPELPEDPAGYAQCVSDAGYFEAVRLTAEDLERSRTYRDNAAREESRASATDLAGYLASLDMRLIWGRFDPVGLPRAVQLINKTNQFNLTTRRYAEAEAVAVMESDAALHLQLRLTDRFGDNGIIAIIIGKPTGEGDIELDTWLMSCRVLGRRVEQSTLNVIVDEARRLGARRLIGEYRPTAKNEMVRNHYAALGFQPLSAEADGVTRWVLSLADYTPGETFSTTVEM